jgi:hypothetical protein
MSQRYKYTTARQVGGDDGYQWCVFVKGDARPRITGLTRPEVRMYRVQIERDCERAVERRKQHAAARQELQEEIAALVECLRDPDVHPEDAASYREEIHCTKQRLAELKQTHPLGEHYNAS